MSLKGQGRRGLDSALLRQVLVLIQHAELAKHPAPSIQEISRTLGRSSSVIARYVVALKDSGHIHYQGFSEGTIRVKEWL